jgi:hypothetical protein
VGRKHETGDGNITLMMFSLDDQGEKMSRETSYDTPLSGAGHFCDIAQKIVGCFSWSRLRCN